MSTFIQKATHPKTKQKQLALFIDDYFGHHKYGVAFRKDGSDVTLTEDMTPEAHDIYPIEEVEPGEKK